MKKLLLVIILCNYLWGCSSIELDRQRFVDYHQFRIGKPFKQYSLIKPVGQQYIGEDQIKYLFEYNKCSWWILVESEVIIEWGVVSAPDNCVIELSYGPG